MVTAVFCVCESGMRVNSIGSQFTIYQYLEIVDNADKIAVMQSVFRFIMACSLVVFHELCVVGKDASPALSLDDNRDCDEKSIASDEEDAGKDNVSEDN